MTIELTTDDYWEVDGVPLNTYAYNISSLAGRFSTPPLRGDDQAQAFRPGRAFRPKVADSRTVPLAMWVQGSDPSQVNAPSSPQFLSNLRMLLKLFYTPGRQFELTRRWTDLEGQHVVKAKGQVLGAIDPSFQGSMHSAMVIDVFLADPFYYGVGVGAEVASSTDPVHTFFSLDVPGDEFSPEKFRVTFHGPSTTPVLKNLTTGTQLTFNATLAEDDAELNIGANRAVMAGKLYNSSVQSTGPLWWMDLALGVNQFEFTAASGGGLTILYQPAYI